MIVTLRLTTPGRFIGTEHMPLALLEFEDGTGVLSELGIDKAKAGANITKDLNAVVADQE